MLASQMNEMVHQGQLANGCLIQLNEFLCQIMQGKK